MLFQSTKTRLNSPGTTVVAMSPITTGISASPTFDRRREAIDGDSSMPVTGTPRRRRGIAIRPVPTAKPSAPPGPASRARTSTIHLGREHLGRSFVVDGRGGLVAQITTGHLTTLGRRTDPFDECHPKGSDHRNHPPPGPRRRDATAPRTSCARRFPCPIPSPTSPPARPCRITSRPRLLRWRDANLANSQHRPQGARPGPVGLRYDLPTQGQSDRPLVDESSGRHPRRRVAGRIARAPAPRSRSHNRCREYRRLIAATRASHGWLTPKGAATLFPKGFFAD